MASISQNRVIVTPKGVDLQVQLLRDTLSPPFRAPSPSFDLNSSHHPKTFRSTSSSSVLPTYFFPKPGYFGPKPSAPSDRASMSQVMFKDSVFYPNYLKKDAKEYPQKHICTWKPKSTLEGPSKISEEVPNGKYTHHSLFNETMSRFNDSPKVNQLNSLVVEKSTTLQRSPKSPNSKSVSMHASQTSFYSPRMSSTGFSRFSSSSRKFEVRDERLVNKCIENEKNYQKLLERFDEETKKRINRYQENQHEAPEFEKKMKEEDNALLDLEMVKINEKARLTGRLKTLQKRKYERTWKKHEEFFAKSGPLSNRELKPAEKKEEARLVIPFNSARDLTMMKEFEKPMSVESLVRSPTLTLTKKVSFFAEEVVKPPQPQISRRPSNAIVMKRFEIK